MPKPSTSKSKSAPDKNANPPGERLTAKHNKAARNKPPERRNENKVRGR